MGRKLSSVSIVRPKSVDGRISDASGRMAGLAMIVITALMAGGCLGRDGETDEARLQVNEYRDELRMINQSNDVLRREISDTYASCDLIGNQLTLMAAMNIHDQYTDGLGKKPQMVVSDPVVDQQPVKPPVGQPTTVKPPVDRTNVIKPPVAQPAVKPTPKVDLGGDASIDWGID